MSRHFLLAIPLALASLVPIALAQEPRFGATVEVRIIEGEAWSPIAAASRSSG
ncbi:MAG TPA: hypothetical protein VMS56_13805 [Thermoanaerobaculia bacterium]|nr:hypothetical protein [Thermoanaerobaculia bacterium]